MGGDAPKEPASPMLDQTRLDVKITDEPGESDPLQSEDKEEVNYSNLPPFPQTATQTEPPRSLLSNPRYSTPLGALTLGISLTSKSPLLLWALSCVIPLVYLVVMFGAIPIGERLDDDDIAEKDSQHRFYHYWIFTCVVNPINMTVIGFLNAGIFLSCMGVDRPFRIHWSIISSVFIVQVVVFNVIVPFTGTFDFFGVVSLFLTYIATFVAIYYYETWKVGHRCKEGNTSMNSELEVVKRYYWQYVKVAVAFLIFFLILLLFMWAYQHVSSVIGQKLLPFGMTIGVFIIRKVMLALTDPFPLSTAMLISGFWVENIYDMFQTMAYRNVKTPVNYVSIWFTNALSLLANVVFLLDIWFEFRIWIKAYLPLAFRGKFKNWRLGIKPDLSEDHDERGHSNNKIGYHRRQGRFFMYKVFSKCIAAIFYFLISTILRYGNNKQLFPFATDSYDEYVNSLQFSVTNLVFLILAGVLASVYVFFQHRALFDYFARNAEGMLTSRHMLGAVVALLISNGIIAISMMMYFNMIYYVVRDDD